VEVGLIGTGLMGLPMAQRLVEAGEALIVYNRTSTKLEPLREAGVAIAPSPEALLQLCDCVVLMLTNAQAIREIILSESCRPLLSGKTVIQMGTIAPSESITIGNEIAAAGGDYLEAPVLGSIPEAKAGKLIVMVGASLGQFAQWQELLKCLGPDPILVGEVGVAAAMKLALNQLIASLTTAFATSLSFVQQQGGEAKDFMQILRQSALYAPTFDKKLQRMLDQNYADPNFPTKHLLKDTNLFLNEAASLHIDPSITATVAQILQRTVERGFADTDYAALYGTVSSGADQAASA
jgi:3-hydroxyisobutyrate dehydrogenase